MECRFGRTLRAPWSCRLIWPRHRIMMISPNEGLPCCHSHSTSMFTQAGKKMPPSVIHEWIQDVGAILKVELRTICLLDKFNFHIVGLFCCCWVLFLHRTLPIILHVGKCILARMPVSAYWIWIQFFRLLLEDSYWMVFLVWIPRPVQSHGLVCLFQISVLFWTSAEFKHMFAFY